MGTHVRNLNSGGRNNLADFLTEPKSTLSDHPIRRFLIGDENDAIQVWPCRDGIEPKLLEMRYWGSRLPHF